MRSLRPAEADRGAVIPDTSDSAAQSGDEGRERAAWFWALVSGWLSLNLVFRWLAWTLFHGHGVYGWERPGTLELSLLLASTVLSAALAASLASRLHAWRAVPHGVVAPLVAFLGLAWVEADMAWVHFSQTHLAWRDVHMFLTESWSEHFGLRGSDFVHSGLVVGLHGGVLAACWFAAGRLRRRAPLPRVGGRVLVVLLALAACDWLAVGWRLERAAHEAAQWRELEAKNPVRIRAFDGLRAPLLGADEDLEAAREALRAAEPAAHLVGRRPAQAAEIDTVLVVAIESLSAAQCDSASMPFLASLAERGVVCARHYSVGNCTHYGLLGLVFGAPVWFYRGVEREGLPQSEWIDALTEAGFESRYIGSDLTSFRHVGEYMTNFTRPDFRGGGSELVGALREELAASGKRFVLLFYGDTHYPYPHAPEFARFVPEVPDDFDYSAWDVRDHREAIVNRYRNALLECDAWLRDVLAVVDLERTLVVVTGDHGQEFFENGRLAHGSALDEPQLRTPCVVLAPGLAPGTIERITSHADVMPTVFALVGERRASLWSASLLDDTPGLAIAAQNEHTRAPRLWTVITDAGKSVLSGGRGEPLELVRLVDGADEPVRFGDDPARWSENFGWARRLERALLSGAR